MTKDLWINLPVKDVNKSKEFFSKIGFAYKEGPGNSPVSTAFEIGDKKIILMLFEKSVFRNFTGNNVTDSKQSTEVLFSIDAESRAEVDDMAMKAKDAGGFVFAEPGENQGWMYGCGFADLDGHRWNVLYMDMSKMPK